MKKWYHFSLISISSKEKNSGEIMRAAFQKYRARILINVARIMKNYAARIYLMRGKLSN